GKSQMVVPHFRFCGKIFLGLEAKIPRLRPRGTRDKSEASFDSVASMSDLFGITPLGQHGGKRPGAGRPRKGEIRPPRAGATLNSRGRSTYAYILARLARDAQEGCREAAILLEGVHNNLISAYAAGCEMNYVKRRELSGRGSPNVTKRNDWAMHRL